MGRILSETAPGELLECLVGLGCSQKRGEITFRSDSFRVELLTCPGMFLIISLSDREETPVFYVLIHHTEARHK